jgi:hypothetical protein
MDTEVTKATANRESLDMLERQVAELETEGNTPLEESQRMIGW